MHVKVRLAATAAAVAANPIQLAPASTAWLAVAAAVRAAMVVAVVAVVDLAEVAEAAEVVAVVVAVVAVAVATVAVDLSVADQKSISNSLACDRQWPGHRTSCLGCAVHGAWSPCRAFWHATF